MQVAGTGRSSARLDRITGSRGSWLPSIQQCPWGVARNDPLGAALAAGGLVLPQVIGAMIGTGGNQVAAYSYLFAAHRELGMRYG